jgi:excisionase family DNA binding protein
VTPLRFHDTARQAVSEDSALMTLPEAARELRCSKSHLYRLLSGKQGGPRLPVFHIGRKSFVRKQQLHAWIRSLEDIERENASAGRFVGIRDEWEGRVGA